MLYGRHFYYWQSLKGESGKKNKKLMDGGKDDRRKENKRGMTERQREEMIIETF